MKILENTHTYTSSINHMLDQIEEAVDMLNGADSLEDEKLEKAVRVMYNGSDAVIDRLTQMEVSAEPDYGVSEYQTHGYDERTYDPFGESKQPVKEGYIEDRCEDVVKACKGVVEAASYFGESVNAVNKLSDLALIINDAVAELKGGDKAAKKDISAAASAAKDELAHIDSFIAKLQTLKAQALEAIQEAEQLSAKVVVPR